MKQLILSVAMAFAALVVTSSPALAQGTRATVTFAKDVAPVLYKNCVECHRSGMFAPMSLVTYDEVRPWARAIRQRVVQREMPPWSADPSIGTFRNDPRLSQKDIDTIAAWVDAGSPKGDDRSLPPVPQFAEGWTIGQPDAVFSMTEEFKVPAEGTIPYVYMRIPTNLTEDKWIQAVEIRPSNRAVVHHVIASLQAAGGNPRDEQAPGRSGLGGTTPNKPGITYEPGVARLLRAGSEIILQMHYTTMGLPATDRTSVGVIYAKQPPKRVLGGGNVLNPLFLIPAYADHHEVKATRTFTEDTKLTALTPHMHSRGKDMTYVAHYPDGKSETLLSVPKYDFNWQISYQLAQPKVLPKGTRLEVIAHFDNSPKNLANPDPSKDVRWGDQTWEEMMIGFYTTELDVTSAKTGASQ